VCPRHVRRGRTAHPLEWGSKSKKLRCEKLKIYYLFKKLPFFFGTQTLLPFSKYYTSGLYTEPDESNPWALTI